MKLAHPPTDPALAQLLRGVVEVARQRQQRAQLLAGPRARLSRRNSVSGFKAPGRGGFVPIEQDPAVDEWHSGHESESTTGPSQGSAIGPGPSSAAGGPATSGEQVAPGAMQGAAGGMQATLGGMSTMQAGPTTPLADSRGRDWALPNSTHGALGITRPITVRCHADRLVLRPEPGTLARSQVVPMEASTRSAVQPLVDAIWSRVESWGIAGPGVYWKPELHVSVGPDAEARFVKLQALMQGSGIAIVRE